MITQKVANLFAFIDYLHSNLAYFLSRKPLVNEILELRKEQMRLKPNLNYRDRIKDKSLQIKINEKYLVVQENTTKLILEKISDFGIANSIKPILNLTAHSDLIDLKKNFEEDDLLQIMQVKKKYLEFRNETQCFYFLQMFFLDLDRDLKEFFDFFSTEQDEGFLILSMDSVKVTNLEDVFILIKNGKSVSMELNNGINDLENNSLFHETNDTLKKDFNTEYRKLQQMGNDSIYLSKQFEDDGQFMNAFQEEFNKAPLKPDVSKYWRLYYTEKEIEDGFHEAHKLIIPKTSKEMVAADMIPFTTFESHLNDLHNEFIQLVISNNTPKNCFTHDIQKTNIYQQFKIVQELFDSFKKLDNNKERSSSDLLRLADEYGKSIIREVDKISYTPIRMKLIDVIICDKENIYFYINSIVDLTKRIDDVFIEDYNKVKMFLNNNLSSYVKKHVGLENDNDSALPITVQSLSISQIALKYVYENIQITRGNGNQIAFEFGHKSGEKLFQKYSYYSSFANRVGKPLPCTPRKFQNKIKLLENVYELVDLIYRDQVYKDILKLRQIYDEEYL